MGKRREKEFENLYRLYKDDIFRTCVLYLRDYHLAEDAAQETLVKAYRRLGAFKGKSSVKTWVTRICINTCKDMLRKRKDESALEGDIAAKEDNFDERLSLSQAVSALPYELREVVILYYYHGFTMKETAAVCRTKIPNVEYRLNKAKRLLKNMLGDDFCE